jgi:hypothetical protein
LYGEWRSVVVGVPVFPFPFQAPERIDALPVVVPVACEAVSDMDMDGEGPHAFVRCAPHADSSSSS